MAGTITAMKPNRNGGRTNISRCVNGIVFYPSGIGMRIKFLFSRHLL
jgi:hypothetical protein